jgi:hypothetical protein
MPPLLASFLGTVKCQGMSLLMPFGLDIDRALAPEKHQCRFGRTTQQKSAVVKKFPLNKINSPLHFICFFKPLRYFVASAFAARL